MTYIVQAIETRYLGPTNTKGSRIKACAGAGSVTVPYDYGMSTERAHAAAAKALRAKLGWTDGHWAQGGNVKGNGYVFVRAD